MSPVAISQHADPAPKVVKEQSEHRSGDPNLTYPHDEVMAPPVFKDRYEERKYLKHRLVLAFRIFAQFKFAEGVAGHITLRDPVDPECFWVNPFGSPPTHVLDS